MRAITLCGLLLALTFSTLHAEVQGANLISNGSFESGDFTSWTLTGNASVENTVPTEQGSYACVLNPGSSLPNAILGQQFSVNAGQPYELIFSYGCSIKTNSQSIVASIVDDTGNYLVYSQHFVNPGNSTGYHTYTSIFVPTTPVMTLNFQDTSSAGTNADGLLDNVEVIAVPPFNHSGEYIGTDVETLSYSGHPIIDSKTLTVKVEIDDAGRMLALVGPFFDALVGTIDNTGAVTIGSNGDFTGTATFSGNAIVINVTQYENVGGNFAYSTLVNTRHYVLRRVAAAQ